MANGKAIAIANNDYVHIAWDFGALLPECAGFAVYRIEQGGDGTAIALPTFARDASGNRLKVTCEDQPVRKYSWRDVYAKRGGTYKYRVVPMRAPNQPLAGYAPAETAFVALSPAQLNGKVQVYFNRGILATQKVSDTLWNPAKEKPDFALIEKKINDPADPLRLSLSGQLFAALTQLLDRAATEGGSCWASLYELTDPGLIAKLADCRDLHLILSNDNDEKTQDKKKIVIYDGKNQPGVHTLGTTGPAGKKLEIYRRYMPSGQIGHNKFLVYVAPDGTAKAVLTGSTNWTASGLCTQSNNAILIESEELAAQYIEYWEQLRADAELAVIPDAPAPMKNIQGPELRGQCAVQRDLVQVGGAAEVQAWYSPNVAKKATGTPIDLAQVYKLIEGAKQSVLFLAFMPGAAGSANSQHFLKKLADVAIEKPWLFVRGAVSDPALTKEFDLTILNSGPNEDVMISSPQGIFKNFEAWRAEIYKYGHAIIHDKTIVIDPFSPDCAVITGSHNLGFRASTNNDENMLIIRGAPAIALAYTAHVMDIFEHYRSRWINAGQKKQDYDPNKDNAWQGRYFDPMKPACAERQFWVSDGAPLEALADNSALAKAAAALNEKKKAEDAAKAAKKAAKAAAKKAASKEPAAKKTAAKKVAAKKTATKKVAAKKAATKKVATKKVATKKAATKKVATKKTAAKKATSKKAVTKKIAAKKTATKKAAAKKAATKKAAPKKAAVKKAVTKKSAAKKVVTKKAATKKVATKKVATKKTASKKAPAKKSTKKAVRKAAKGRVR